MRCLNWLRKNERGFFIKKLYSEKVDENVIKTLVGHEKEFTMKHYGGDPFSPERLLEEISKVNYSGTNWKKQNYKREETCKEIIFVIM